ncbi:MAG: PDZ domain-containing protein [Bacteroidota bacterium]
MTDYWELIRSEITKRLGQGDPKDWKEADISTFLDRMENSLVELCRNDPQKADKCQMMFREGIPYRRSLSGAKPQKWKNIDNTTFRRLFQSDKKPTAQSRTQELFAVYLGHQSKADLLEKLGEYDLKEKQASSGGSEQTRRSSYWQVSWLLVAVLLYFAHVDLEAIVTNPLLIGGLVLLGVLSIHRLIIRSHLIPPLEQKQGHNILQLILRYGFFIALAIIGGGVITSATGIFDAAKDNEAAVDIVKEKALEDLNQMASFLKLMETQTPDPYLEGKSKLYPNELEYRKQVQKYYQSYQQDLQHMYNEYPLNTATFDAHKNRIIDKDKAKAFLKAYTQLEEVRQSISTLLTQLSQLYKYPRNSDKFFAESKQTHALKITDARIALGQAGNSLMPALTESETDVYRFTRAMKRGKFEVSAQTYAGMYRQLNEELGKLQKEKLQLLSNQSGIPLPISQPMPLGDTMPPDLESLLPEIDSLLDSLDRVGYIIPPEKVLQMGTQNADRRINRKINNTYLKRIRTMAGQPPDSLTDAEFFSLSNRTLRSTETNVDTLMDLVFDSFISSDEAAIVYYLQKILQDKSLSQLQRTYVEKSLERMDIPNLYEGSVGVMIVKILSVGAFQQAGFQVGDVIYKVNGTLVSEPEEISELTTATRKDNVHRIEFYRRGAPTRKDIPADMPLGGVLSQLIAWRPARL